MVAIEDQSKSLKKRQDSSSVNQSILQSDSYVNLTQCMFNEGIMPDQTRTTSQIRRFFLHRAGRYRVQKGCAKLWEDYNTRIKDDYLQKSNFTMNIYKPLTANETFIQQPRLEIPLKLFVLKLAQKLSKMSFCINKYWIKTGEQESVLLHVGNQARHQQLLQKYMTIYNQVLILPNTSLCSSHGLTL